MTDTKKEKPSFSFTDPVRGTYVHACEPQAFKENGVDKGDPKFGATFIIEPVLIDGKIDPASDFGRLQIEVVTLLKSMYPGKKLVVDRRMTQEELDQGAVEVNVPWFKGAKEVKRLTDKGKPDDAKVYEGKMCVKASSKYRPALDAIENRKVISFTDEGAIKAAAQRFFFSGAWFIPTFGLNAYPAKGGKIGGVSLYLNGLLNVPTPKGRDGGKLGGRTHNPAEAYKGYLGKISQEDPTDGDAFTMDDEIPF